jgi:4-amino-4-deoxy-L-arabinose transferase-like glycosyltransferase
MSDLNWVFGVRTAGRVEGREAWRQWVYIESGYVWMLWTGGVVLLVGVVVLLILIARTGRRLSSSVEPTTGALGTTLITVAWMLAGLLVFDPHLTFRGAGDVLFILLALGANLDRRASRPDAVRHGSERALTKLVAFPASGTR